MNELKVINEQEILGKLFRIYGDVENPLFLAKDVANWIEYSESNVSKLVNAVDEDEKCTRTIITSEANSTVAWFLTEEGVYEVLMQSRKPIAKEFKKAVKEILKTIRKTGGYVVENRAIDFVSNWLPNLDDTSKNAIAGMLEENQKLRLENNKQKEIIEVQKPKAEYFDALVDTNLLTNFRDSAKEIGVTQTLFIEYLLENGFVYRDGRKKLKPIAKYVTEGLFKIKDYTKGNYSDVQTLITPKGKETFRLLLSKFIK